jgi:hypothetical protein
LARDFGTEKVIGDNPELSRDPPQRYDGVTPHHGCAHGDKTGIPKKRLKDSALWKRRVLMTMIEIPHAAALIKRNSAPIKERNAVAAWIIH